MKGSNMHKNTVYSKIFRRALTLLTLLTVVAGMIALPLGAAADVQYASPFKPAQSANIKVTLSTNSTMMRLGKNKTFTLTASVNLPPNNVQSVTWSSSAPAIASVSATGVVTALKCGTAVITCKAVSYPAKASAKATCKVYVYDGSVSLSAKNITLNIVNGATQRLKCTLNYSDNAQTPGTWSTSNAKVATVSANGTVKPKGLGTATITCTSTSFGTKATCTVTVTEKRVLSASPKEQTHHYTCAGAAARTVLAFLGKAKKSDMQLYNEIEGYSGGVIVGNIVKALNNNIGKTLYTYNTYNTQSKFQNAVMKSVKAGYPVIALVRITDTKYFKYDSDGHFTVIRGYEKTADGTVTFYMADSYRTNKNGGTFAIPAGSLFAYSKAHKNCYYLIHGK